MNLSIESIAKICHEANRAYCEETDDFSQTAWEEAPDWQKNSAINGVEYHLKNEVTPEQSHENWRKEKLADGWVYGEVKDAEAREHPCMVPFAELPEGQQVKDHLFSAIVSTFKKA